MDCIPQKNPAYRRYMARLFGAAVVYVGAVFLASRLIPDHAHASPGIIAVALIPGAATLAMIWAIARLFVELDDEYLRMREVRKAMIATGLLLSLASVWGLLELMTDVPRVPVFYVFPVWSTGLAVGGLWNRIAGL